jgi:hypothetical protein
MSKIKFNWDGTRALESHQFTCGYCGSFVASKEGWYGASPMNSNHRTKIYLCHLCGNPTSFIYDGGQIPGVPFGNPVKEIPNPLVEQLYEEARRATRNVSITLRHLGEKFRLQQEAQRPFPAAAADG